MPGSSHISEDLSELIGLLNIHQVDFIVAGAHALAFHGIARFTEDIDFFLSRSSINITRFAEALKEFGIPMSDQAQQELKQKERGVIFLGEKPNRVDFLNFLDGVDYETAKERKIAGQLGGNEVNYLSLEDYIATKRASARPKDWADLKLLEKRIQE